MQAVIENAEGGVCAGIRVVERADNDRSRKAAGEMKVDPAGLDVYLLDVLAYFPGHLWQERAQGPQPLSARDLSAKGEWEKLPQSKRCLETEFVVRRVPNRRRGLHSSR
jgi:hypothetical protein